MKPLRVLLADDHQGVLDHVRGCLEPDFSIVGTVGDGRELVDRALALEPDVVVTDIAMPRMSGLEAVRELRRRGNTSHVIFLTVHAGPEFVDSALAAGAGGYVLKSEAAAALRVAIKAVAVGEQ